MAISCVCIWTPPVSDSTQCGVQSNCTPNHYVTILQDYRIIVLAKNLSDFCWILLVYTLIYLAGSSTANRGPRTIAQ